MRQEVDRTGLPTGGSRQITTKELPPKKGSWPARGRSSRSSPEEPKRAARNGAAGEVPADETTPREQNFLYCATWNESKTSETG